MKIMQEVLLDALKQVVRFTSTRSTLPVLANVKIEPLNDDGYDVVKLSATNLEQAVQMVIPVSGSDIDPITIPGRTLADLIATFPNDCELDVSTDKDDESITIKNGRQKAKIKGIDVDEFPILPEQSGGGVVINAVELARLFNQTAFCTARDDTRPMLTGVHLSLLKGRLTAESTDGFVLAQSGCDLGKAGNFDVILPQQTAAAIANLASGEVLVANNGNRMQFKWGKTVLTSQLIEGDFPEVAGVIPVSDDSGFIVNGGVLRKMFKTADIFARDVNHTAVMDIGDGGVAINAVSAETGNNVGFVDAEIFGEPVKVAVNTKYMIDFMGVVGTPQVKVVVNDSTSPIKILPVGDNSPFVGVIMPMHLGK